MFLNIMISGFQNLSISNSGFQDFQEFRISDLKDSLTGLFAVSARCCEVVTAICCGVVTAKCCGVVTAKC